MKISKRDLRRLILENMLKEEEEAATPASSGADDAADDSAAAAANEVDDRLRKLLVIYNNNKTDDTKTKSAAAMRRILTQETPSKRVFNDLTSKIKELSDLKVKSKADVSSQKVKSKSKSNSKIAAIQKIIKAPSSDAGTKLGDGEWGGGTTEAWKAWVVNPETIQKIEKLKKDKEAALKAENKYLNLNLLFEDTLDDAAADAAAEDSAIAKFVRDNAGNAASIAKELGYKPNLSGVDEMLKALEALDTSTADKDQNSVQELTAEQRGKFEELNKLLDSNVSAGDMRTIHGIVHDLHSTDIFKKIKAVSAGTDQEKNTLLKSLTAATDRKIATNILSNFSAGNYGAGVGIVFPLAKGPMFKSLDGESENLSFSVLVDDVEGIFLGKKPVYVKTGDARTSSEKAPAPVAESLSHGTLIRNRYGRY